MSWTCERKTSSWSRWSVPNLMGRLKSVRSQSNWAFSALLRYQLIPKLNAVASAAVAAQWAVLRGRERVLLAPPRPGDAEPQALGGRAGLVAERLQEESRSDILVVVGVAVAGAAVIDTVEETELVTDRTSRQVAGELSAD